MGSWRRRMSIELMAQIDVSYHAFTVNPRGLRQRAAIDQYVTLRYLQARRDAVDLP